jgi:PAS domain S-box-containing protein
MKDDLAASQAEIEKLSEELARLEEENALLEEALSRNGKLFEALLSGSNQGITLTGPDRRIVRVVKGLTDFNAVSLAGESIERLAIPDDRESIVEAYRQLLAGRRRKIGIVVRVMRADGEVVRHAATLTDMLDNPCVQGIVWNYSVAL